MSYCWSADPSDRPPFSELVAEFEQLLGEEADYIDLNQVMSFRTNNFLITYLYYLLQFLTLQFPEHAYYNHVGLEDERV